MEKHRGAVAMAKPEEFVTRAELERILHDLHRKLDHLADAQIENVKAIANLTDNTQEVVAVYNDLKSTARVGAAIQKFLIWLAKWGAIGAAIASMVSFAVDHFSPRQRQAYRVESPQAPQKAPKIQTVQSRD